jgi:RNA polymerase II-associated factor 1
MSSSNKSTSAQNHRQGHHKSHIQYVAKVRYSNNLPPPACSAKLLKDDKEDSKNSELSSLVSSFFRKENFKNLIRLNDDLGMPLNMATLAAEESIYGLTNSDGMKLQLHPSDELLLADPNKNIKTKSDSVSFLRRTQYISADIAAHSTTATNNSQKLAQMKLQEKKDDGTDPKSQLKAVEDMFTSGEVDLSSIKHPTKKHLKAKRVWNFLPDTSMLDQSYYDIKFMSSASISKNKDKSKNSIKSITDPRLLTSIFKEVDLNQTQKLMSFFLTDADEAAKVKEKLDDFTENAPLDDNELEEILKDESKKSIYKKQREYDCSVKPIDPLRQLVITFDEKSETAYYIPISGKMELKKCRIDPYLAPKIKEMSYDQINMFVREPTKSEIEKRDILRSNFDPMEFGADEDEEEEEDANE